MTPRRLLLLLLVAGCAASGRARLDRDALVGTTWREICPDPAIATAYVRLDADGHMAWSYEHPDSVRVEAVHTWTVEDGVLVLKWNNASATSRYPAGPDPAYLDAEASTFCVDALPWIERLR